LEFLNLYFILLIIFSSILVIISKNPMQSILYLILVFLLTSFIFINIGAVFFSLLLLIIYIGSIFILFIFIIMMLNLRMIEFYNSYIYYIPIITFIAIFFIFELFYFYYINISCEEVYLYNNSTNLIIKSLFNLDNLVLLGIVLFNYYFHLFFLLSLLLLISMIGSIILVYKKK